MSIGRSGLIHRDLKPANVLLGANGPRVIDFGIAKAVEASQLTRAGDVVGTAGYMAPEQIEGQPLTAATDVFSLGAVLAFALTGIGPYGEGTWQALMGRVLYQEPDLSQVPNDWVDIIRQCLAKDPAARPTLNALRDWCVPAGQSVASLFEGDWLPDEANSIVEQQTMTAQRQQTALRHGRAGAGYLPSPTASTARPGPSRWSPRATPRTATRAGNRQRWTLVAGLGTLVVCFASGMIVEAWPDNPAGRSGSPIPSSGGAAAGPETERQITGTPPDKPQPSRSIQSTSTPEGWTGSWRGSSASPWNEVVIIKLRPGKVGEKVGQIDFPLSPCSGELTLISRVGATVTIHERITKDPTRSCRDEAKIEFTLEGDMLSLQWLTKGAFEPRRKQATLRRE